MSPLTSLPPIPNTTSPDTILILHTSVPTWPRASSSTSSGPVHICVLDSSFNPPTLAHLALASSTFPPSTSSTPPQPQITSRDDEYTALLLLFSTTNVDKSPKATDPSLAQRAEMMLLLARRLSTTPSTSSRPVAIGLLNQPTFAGKSRVIHDYLRTQQEGLDVRLTFLIGTDTLTRFFVPKYYASQEGGMDGALRRFFDEGSTVVSARRGNERVEEEVLEWEVVGRWAREGRVRLLGNGDEEWVGISSTKVREAVGRGDGAGLRGLVMDEVADYVESEGLYR